MSEPFEFAATYEVREDFEDWRGTAFVAGERLVFWESRSCGPRDPIRDYIFRNEEGSDGRTWNGPDVEALRDAQAHFVRVSGPHPLCAAAAEGQIEQVREILAKEGASISAQVVFAALTLAVHGDNGPVVSLLRRLNRVDPSDLWTLVYRASEDKLDHALVELFESDSEEAAAALSKAASRGRIDTVRLLLERGVDPDELSPETLARFKKRSYGFGGEDRTAALLAEAKRRRANGGPIGSLAGVGERPPPKETVHDPEGYRILFRVYELSLLSLPVLLWIDTEEALFRLILWYVAVPGALLASVTSIVFRLLKGVNLAKTMGMAALTLLIGWVALAMGAQAVLASVNAGVPVENESGRWRKGALGFYYHLRSGEEMVEMILDAL